MADQAETLREIMRTQMNGNSQSGISNGKKKSSTRVITIASGKGGVGKTNVSTNIALCLAKAGKRVILMDADLGLANVNVILGIVPKYNLFHLIRKQKALSDILIEASQGLRLIAGASGFSKAANLLPEDRKLLVRELLKLGSADFIIVDAGAGVSGNVLSFVTASDETIIVTTPEPTAITDAYGIIKVIATETDGDGPELRLLVNRVKTISEGKKVAERVINIASSFLNLKIEYLGYLYDDEVVPQAVIKQKPFYIHEPKSKASACIQQIVQRLARVDSTRSKGIAGFLSRLLGKK